MRIILAAAMMLLAITGRLFAEGSLYIENNPKAAWKIINLDSQDIKGLEIKDNTTFTFNKAKKFEDVSGGDVLVAGACKEIPNGFIKKVVSIREKGNKVILETVEGGLEDILKGRLADNTKPVPVRPDPAADK